MRLEPHCLKPLPKTSWMFSMHEYKLNSSLNNKMAVLEHPASENLDFQPGSVTSPKLDN